MSKKDYRQKIEEHRQSIHVEGEPNSRLSRSRGTVQKVKKRRDPLMTILTVVFIFIPLVILVYVWGFYTPFVPSQAAEDNVETVEYERNDNVSEDNANDEPVFIDDMEEDITDDEQSEEENTSNNEDSTTDTNNEESEVVNEEQTNDESTNFEEQDGQAEEENNDEVANETEEETESNGNVHVVEEGDTLYSIANRNSTSVDEIMEANNLDTESIFVGQELIIP